MILCIYSHTPEPAFARAHTHTYVCINMIDTTPNTTLKTKRMNRYVYLSVQTSYVRIIIEFSVSSIHFKLEYEKDLFFAQSTWGEGVVKSHNA